MCNRTRRTTGARCDLSIASHSTCVWYSFFVAASFDNGAGFVYNLTWQSGLPLLKRLQTQADGVRVLIYNGDEDPGISSFKTQVRARRGSLCSRLWGPEPPWVSWRRIGRTAWTSLCERRGARGPLARTRPLWPAPSSSGRGGSRLPRYAALGTWSRRSSPTVRGS